MKIVCFAADRGACGHYRIRLPVSYMTPAVDVELWDDVPVSIGKQGPVVNVDQFVDAGVDVVVLQRVTGRIFVDGIERLQRAGIGVVVEIDDDLSAIDPENPAWTGLHPKLNPNTNWQHFGRAVRQADVVTCSTEALAQRYGSGRAIVLHNYVSERMLDVNVDTEKTVGWTGHIQTHPHDLQVVGNGVNAACLESDVPFVHIGGSHPEVARALGLTCKTVEVDWLPIDGYYRRMAAIGVGIVPLADTAFNRAKSWIKGLEFAALGVPFVASPLAEYTRLGALGAGVLAHKPRAWRRNIVDVLEDESLRAELSNSGRQVAGDLTMDKHWHLWLEAWHLALRRRRDVRRAA